MNYGSLIFLGVFFSFALSWSGMVLAPQLQLGRQQLEKVGDSGLMYPSARAGLAAQGREVYRNLGCQACHSQQVRQTGVEFDVYLTDAGTNQTDIVEALAKVGAKGADLNGLPKRILKGISLAEADSAVKALTATSAQAERVVVPLGTDIARGWGKRGTVGQDYLRDEPVLLGSQRIGPDLADVGNRVALTKEWHLLHLYSPQSFPNLAKSSMPPYRFLFEKRKVGRTPSPEALPLSKDFALEAGYEIVPKREALALVAYLQSLRVDESLFEAPAPIIPQAKPQQTNAAPNAAVTNAAATSEPKGSAK